MYKHELQQQQQKKRGEIEKRGEGAAKLIQQLAFVFYFKIEDNIFLVIEVLMLG